MATIETTESIRQRVANTANQENHAKDATKYWADVLSLTWRGPYPSQWCGAFVLWCLRTSLGCGLQWEVSSGFLHHLPQLRRGAMPELGDIAYLDNPYQHHAVVVAAGLSSDGVPYVITMDGNSGSPPGEVIEHWSHQSCWTCFFSIDRLVDDCLAAWQELNQPGDPDEKGHL
jgi:hypothetical protein